MKLQGKHDLNGALIGVLLGDGHLVHRGRSSSLIFGHVSKHQDYVDWKADLISAYIAGEQNIIPAHIRVRDGYQRKEYVRYQSQFYEFLNELWKDFYRSPIDDKPKIKRVNLRLLHRLTELGLAIWYMDDGSLHKNNRNCSLATHCFTREENEIVRDWFWDRYQIELRITKHNNYWYLAGTVESSSRLIEIVSPYVGQVDSMSYKIEPKPYLHNNRGRPARTKSQSEPYGNIGSVAEMTTPATSE